MAIYEHKRQFAGKPVQPWPSEKKSVPSKSPDRTRSNEKRGWRLGTTLSEIAQIARSLVGKPKLPHAPAPIAQSEDQIETSRSSVTAAQPGDEIIYRIALSYEQQESGQRWSDVFAEFLDRGYPEQATGLVVGAWTLDFRSTSAQVVDTLIAARDRMPQLEALFVGDIVSEECEISWIEQGNMVPLLDAFPNLKHFGVRGGNGLQMRGLRHSQLETLIVESGGLGGDVVRDIVSAGLPSLTHLELWLGTPNYGATATVDDLAPLFAGEVLPSLTYLGLRDSEIADQIAVAVADAPILDRIRVLDLSLGTLTDNGAQALLTSPKIAQLDRMDLHHHFCTDDTVHRLTQLRMAVDVSEQRTAEEFDGETWRYVAVGE